MTTKADHDITTTPSTRLSKYHSASGKPGSQDIKYTVPVHSNASNHNH